MTGNATTHDYRALMAQALLKLEQTEAKLRALQQAQAEPVAVVGLSCRFPGGADDPERFWTVLTTGVDGIVEVPASRWDIDAYYDPDPDAPGKMNCRFGGFIGEPSWFDAGFFGIAPREAASLDPQQRLLLELAWEALEHANQPSEGLVGSRTGCFIGLCNTDYGHRLFARDHREIDAYLGSGVAASMAAGRLSYTLGLQGPAFTVDTACSSSLLAVHLACESLRRGECETALAGGVNRILEPEIAINFTKARMLAPDGHCKTFDAAADGYVRGEGGGMAVLKRLGDAQRDGDRIFAIIRGSAANHDGRTSGLTAPNGPAQQAVIRQALTAAGLPPERIDYVEAHGTGTSLGDPIEVGALSAVFGRRPVDNPLLLGAVKSQIGHLEAAAGIAGFIKTVLALHHGELPGQLHYHTPNPHIDWSAPVAVVRQRRAWPRSERYAGVSAFGFSGTNVHAVLQAAPAVAPSASSPRPVQLLTLSAKTPAALSALAGRYRDYLQANPDTDLGDLCATANSGRSHLKQRLAVVADSLAELGESLAAVADGQTPPGIYQGQTRRIKIAFLCSGQGAQYAGMGRELDDSQPVYRQALDRCDAILQPLWGRPLRAVLYGDEAALAQTGHTQPALFAVQYALAALWRHWGVQPDALFGHSVGEYIAAHLAGVFSLEDALTLLAERARLMQALPHGGGMAAVSAPLDQIETALRDYPELALATRNSPEQGVVSGRREALEQLREELQQAGIPSQTLNVSHAFHSPLMEPILDAFENAAGRFRYSPPQRLLLDHRGQRVAAESLDAAYWRRQIRQPVHFDQALATLHEQSCSVFLELGPQPVLIGLGQANPQAENATWLASLRNGRKSEQTLTHSLAQLYVQGASLDWSAIVGHSGRRVLSLPTYPFQRQRHWIEANADQGRAVRRARPNDDPLLGARIPSAGREALFESAIGANEPPFLADHRIYRTVILPAVGFLEMALSAGRRLRPTEPVTIEEFAIGQALALAPNPTTVQTVVMSAGQDEAAGREFRIASLTDEESEASAWTVHAHGRLTYRNEELAALDLDGLRNRCQETLDADFCYRQFRDKHVDYGPGFRALQQVWRGEGEALARIAPPVAETDKAYTLHPVALDAGLQVAALNYLDLPDDEAYLPVGLDRFGRRAGNESPSPCWCYARLQPEQPDRSALKSDLYWLDDQGQVLARANGFTVRRAPAAVLLAGLKGRVSAAEAADDVLYDRVWQACDWSENTANPSPARWLVFGDRASHGTALAERLRTSSLSAIEVEAGDGFGQHGGDHFQIDPDDADDFRRLLDAVGDCAECVYLWGLDEPPLADLAVPGDAQGRTLRGLLHLLQALDAARWTGRLWLASRGGQAVEGASPVIEQAPLWGLGRVIAQEYPDWRAVSVDLDPRDGGINDLYRVLSAPPLEEDQLAVRAGRLFAPRLTPHQRTSAEPTPAPAPISASGSYLITGGLGGLGLAVARWLVERGAGRIVLAGRRPAGLEAQAILRELADGGAKVTVMTADIADAEQVKELFGEIEKDGPPLRGVFHAAGVLDDGVLAEQTWDRFARVLAPKLLGAWNLHRQTPAQIPTQTLDHFVCFSSIAGWLGAPGQGNYAAANAFLDALMSQRRRQGLPGTSIAWGPWTEVGMAARLGETDRQRLASRGVTPFTVEHGLAVLERVLENGLETVAAARIDWPRLSETLGPLPLLRNGRGQETQPDGENLDFLRQLREAPPRKRREWLNAHVRAELTQVLRLNPADPIDPRQGLFDLGMDSLTAVEFRNRLQATLACRLPTTLAFEFSTLQALLDHLAEQVLAGEPAKDDPPPTQPIVSETAAVQASVSDEEDDIEALLAEELMAIERGRQGG
ncbi:MAG: type I polyketide synthase [Gammaproteobacteria bacterium]|nr:type I polyketide synthase [Gammaproteobacteria bacterium]